MKWLDVITDSMDMSLSKLQEMAGEAWEAWHAVVHEVAKSQQFISRLLTTPYPTQLS